MSLRLDFPPEVDICSLPECPSLRRDTARLAAAAAVASADVDVDVDDLSADASESGNNIEYSVTGGRVNSDTAAVAAAAPACDYNCDCP